MKKLVLACISVLVVLGCIVCAGCTTTPAEKDYENLLESLNGSSTSYSSGSTTYNGVTYSYESETTNNARTLTLKLPEMEYVLKGSADDPICGDWKGDTYGLIVTFEDDGTGYYHEDADVYGRPFFWGKEDDGTYTVVFVDNSTNKVELSEDTLTDSIGVVLNRQL